MATVRVYLDPDETIEDARESLRKALDESGAAAPGEDFLQPAAKDVCNRMLIEHERMWEAMLADIAKVLEEEVG